MARSCMRTGCDRPAVARLSYDAVSCQVWLDPVPERPGPSQEICDLHATRLTVPRGWMLCDRRGPRPALFVPEAPDAEAPEPAARPSSSLRQPARQPARRRPSTEGAPELFEAVTPTGPDEATSPTPDGAIGRLDGNCRSVTSRVAETVPVDAAPTQRPSTDEPAAERSDPEQDEVDELPDSLRATSPLLARAFRATGPQRSILTQSLPESDG